MALLLCASLILRLSSAAFFMQRVTPSNFKASPIVDQPVLIEEWLDLEKCEEWLDHITTRSAHESVIVQRSKSFESLPLEDAIESAMGKSSHESPVLVESSSSNGSSCSMDQIPLYDLINELYTSSDRDNGSKNNEDFLPLLSYHASLPDTLRILGQGASSTLCSHSYTRYNMCLEGSVVWRLLPPSFPALGNNSATKKVTDVIRDARSLETVAWDGYRFSIGQQSKKSLYTFRDWNIATDYPEDELLGETSTTLYKYQEFCEIAEDNLKLRPNFGLPNENNPNSKTTNWPWHSTVALAGDILVIPAGWWHQCYALETSISILSQRCNSADLTSFLNHILDESNLLDDSAIDHSIIQEPEDGYTKEEARAAIDSVFDLLEEIAAIGME
jgi:hypothetical protein